MRHLIEAIAAELDAGTCDVWARYRELARYRGRPEAKPTLARLHEAKLQALRDRGLT